MIKKRERDVHHPYNLTFITAFDEFPKEFTNSIGVPGEFESIISRKVHENKSEYEMDAPYKARILINNEKIDVIMMLEHLSKPLTNFKTFRIEDYSKHTYLQTGLPVFPIIVSKYYDNLPKVITMDVNVFTVLGGICIDEEKMEETLNNIRNKHNPDNVLSISQGMELVIVILFPPDTREKEILMEAIDYYCNSKIEHPRLRFVLYAAFYCMIDAYIDDEDEFERLINMIKPKATPEERKEYGVLIHMRETIAKLNTEKQTLVNKNETLVNKNETLVNKNETLVNKNETLVNKNETLVNNLNTVVTENEAFSQGIQDLLDNYSDVLPVYVKSLLQQLLLQKSINH